uniref:Uncharacterized protein n=1 Tax=Acrobeloides nanus TaxID=290746 RepID=A0A914E3M8_9BILA
MGNNHSEHPEPLKPVVYVSLPPWVPKYTDKNGNPHSVLKGLIDYNDNCEKTGKRKAFWSELALEHPDVEKGVYIAHSSRIKENDRSFYDPPVPDGTSLAGAFGTDTKYVRNLSHKETIPEKLEDYREKLYRASHQYKQIAEKFDLSPEHPGLDISPDLQDTSYTRYNHLGINQWGHWRQFGPRFFDKPLNEGCLEKGLCLVKYAAVLGIPIAFNSIKARYEEPWSKKYFFQLRPFLKRYFQVNKTLFAGSFVWGASLCVVADFRKRDDIYNHYIVAPFTSLCYYELSGRNLPGAIVLAGILLAGGSMWHYLRCNPQGFTALTHNVTMNDIRFGPLGWKLLDQGSDVPEKVDY